MNVRLAPSGTALTANGLRSSVSPLAAGAAHAVRAAPRRSAAPLAVTCISLAPVLLARGALVLALVLLRVLLGFRQLAHLRRGARRCSEPCTGHSHSGEAEAR